MLFFVPLEGEKQGLAHILMLFSKLGSAPGAEGAPGTWVSLSNPLNLIIEGAARRVSETHSKGTFFTYAAEKSGFCTEGL